MSDSQTIPSAPEVESILSLAQSALSASKTKLNRATINERLNQRQVLVQPNSPQFKEALATAQAEIKVLNAAIEVLEEIIAEEKAKIV
jgi:hypothetical protein